MKGPFGVNCTAGELRGRAIETLRINQTRESVAGTDLVRYLFEIRSITPSSTLAVRFSACSCDPPCATRDCPSSVARVPHQSIARVAEE